MRSFVALTPETAMSAVSCAAFAPPRAALETADSSSNCPDSRCAFASASARRLAAPLDFEVEAAQDVRRAVGRAAAEEAALRLDGGAVVERHGRRHAVGV